MRYKLFKVTVRHLGSSKTVYVVAKSFDTAVNLVANTDDFAFWKVESVDVLAERYCPKKSSKYAPLILEGGKDPKFETKEVIVSADLRLSKKDGITIERQYEGEPDSPKVEEKKKVIDITLANEDDDEEDEEDNNYDNSLVIWR